MSGEESAQSVPSTPVVQTETVSPEQRGGEGEETKPEVRLETWKRWTRSVLENLREPKQLTDLYAVAGRERASQKRVDSILAVLEEAGLAVISQDRAYLTEKQSALTSVIEMERLRKELTDKEATLSSLSIRFTELDAEMQRIKAGVRAIECAMLKPLDIEGYSGQKLFYCTIRRLSMGERAEVCLNCDEKVPNPLQPLKQTTIPSVSEP